MAQILSYSPGQKVSIYLDTTNLDGYYADGYYQDGYSIDGYEVPVVHRMILPDFTFNPIYPKPMTKLDTGIYYYEFYLPTGASSVGSYFVDVYYRDPTSWLLKVQPYIIVVSAPFGRYSATSF